MKKSEYLSENKGVLGTQEGLIDNKDGSWITGNKNDDDSSFPESGEGGE